MLYPCEQALVRVCGDAALLRALIGRKPQKMINRILSIFGAVCGVILAAIVVTEASMGLMKPWDAFAAFVVGLWASDALKWLIGKLRGEQPARTEVFRVGDMFVIKSNGNVTIECEKVEFTGSVKES